MNKLINQNNQISPFLDAEERGMIEAKSGKPIRELKISDVRVFIATLIAKTHQDCGQMLNEKDVENGLKELVDDIVNYGGGFTLMQIGNCFKLGAMRQLGDYYGLNNNTYRQWIRSYLGYQKRLDANKKQKEFLEKLNKPVGMTSEEKENLIREGCISAFDIFKQKGYYPDMGNVTFNFLWAKKVILFSEERRLDFKNQAKSMLLAEKKIQIEKTPSIIGIRNLKSIIKSLEENSGCQDEVIREAKRIALNTFFKELVDIGQDIRDFEF